MAGQGAARSPPARTPSSVVLKQSAPRLSGLKLDPVPKSGRRAGLSDTACLCSTWHHLQRPRGRGTEPLEASFPPAPDGSGWRGLGPHLGLEYPTCGLSCASAFLTTGWPGPQDEGPRREPGRSAATLWSLAFGGHAAFQHVLFAAAFTKGCPRSPGGLDSIFCQERAGSENWLIGIKTTMRPLLCGHGLSLFGPPVFTWDQSLF